MSWHGKTQQEQQAQYTGFSVEAGDVGYLREAYHGGPYVTRYFVQEAFEDDDAREAYHAANPDGDDYRGPEIPAAVLRQRLPRAVIMAFIRYATIYGDEVDPALVGAPDPEDSKPHDSNAPPPPPTSKQAAEELLAHPEVKKKLSDIFAGIEIMKGGGDEKVMAEYIPAALIAMAEKHIAVRSLPDYALAYVNFCELAERKEKETGEPVTVYASY